MRPSHSPGWRSPSTNVSALHPRSQREFKQNLALINSRKNAMLTPDQTVGSLFAVSISVALWAWYLAGQLDSARKKLAESISKCGALCSTIDDLKKTQKSEMSYMNSRVKELESCKIEFQKQVDAHMELNTDYCRRLNYIARAANTFMKFDENYLPQSPHQPDDDEEELDELDDEDEDEEFDVATFAQNAVNQLEKVTDVLNEIIDNA